MWPFRKKPCSILRIVHYKRASRPCMVIVTCTCEKKKHVYRVKESNHGPKG